MDPNSPGWPFSQMSMPGSRLTTPLIRNIWSNDSPPARYPKHTSQNLEPKYRLRRLYARSVSQSNQWRANAIQCRVFWSGFALTGRHATFVADGGNAAAIFRSGIG